MARHQLLRNQQCWRANQKQHTTQHREPAPAPELETQEHHPGGGRQRQQLMQIKHRGGQAKQNEVDFEAENEERCQVGRGKLLPYLGIREILQPVELVRVQQNLTVIPAPAAIKHAEIDEQRQQHKSDGSQQVLHCSGHPHQYPVMLLPNLRMLPALAASQSKHTAVVRRRICGTLCRLSGLTQPKDHGYLSWHATLGIGIGSDILDIQPPT